jgi:SNF2 family DNA or RNA helicase
MVAPNKYQPWPYLKEVLAGEVAKHCYVLRRDQVGMGSHKVYEQMYVDFDDAEYQNQYEKLEYNWANDTHETEWAIVALNYLQQFAGGFPKPKAGLENARSHHKLKELKRLVFEDELQKESILIWCRYVEEIKIIRDALHQEEKCYSIYGDTDSAMRQRFIDDFQARKFRLMVCQIKTASMGIDLATADTAIYYSNSFSATDRLQSEDRIIHPEKKSPVLYIDLMTNNTVDQDVYDALKAKTSSQEEFMNRIIQNMKDRIGK